MCSYTHTIVLSAHRWPPELKSAVIGIKHPSQGYLTGCRHSSESACTMHSPALITNSEGGGRRLPSALSLLGREDEKMRACKAQIVFKLDRERCLIRINSDHFQPRPDSGRSGHTAADLCFTFSNNGVALRSSVSSGTFSRS